MTDWIGRTLSKVQVQSLLGRGGMAEVYRGRHTTLNRPVAVKILHSFLSDDPALNERFRAEAQGVAALRHPNIVQVFDFDVADGRPYIVMEAIEGPSLTDYLRGLRDSGERLPLETVARFIAALAAALDYAHARGIVHRDVKPANAMLRSEPGHPVPLPPAPLPDDVTPVLTDFGVARMVDTSALTASGTITGTPAYMSPEQARGEKADKRADIYSLGIIAYEMLTGQTPFHGDTPTALLLKQIGEPPGSPRKLRADLPPEVDGVILKALAKNPADRYDSAGEFARDLSRALRLAASASTAAVTMVKRAAEVTRPSVTAPRPASRRWLYFAGAAVGLVIVVLGLFAVRGQLQPSGASSAGSATVRFRDGTASLDEASLRVSGLPAPPPGQQYEAWLIGEGGETRHSLGTLALTDGAGQLVFTDDDGHNLLAEFDAVEITVEPSPDPNPLPGATVLRRGQIPPQALVHIRHVLVARSDTPGNVGFGIGLLRQVDTLRTTADVMLAALQAGDSTAARQNAEAMVNLIEGPAGEHYGDLDGDGATTDPGDGFGLLLNGERIGYIQGTIEHARLAAAQADATENIKLHAGHTQASAKNVAEWAVALRDVALAIASADDLSAVEGRVREAVSIAGRIVEGQDLNGNEDIEPIPGEGGALTAYQHALYMADITLSPP